MGKTSKLKPKRRDDPSRPTVGALSVRHMDVFAAGKQLLRNMIHGFLKPVNVPPRAAASRAIAPPDPFAPSIVTTWIFGQLPSPPDPEPDVKSDEPDARVADDIDRLRISDVAVAAPRRAEVPRRSRRHIVAKHTRSPKVGKK